MTTAKATGMDMGFCYRRKHFFPSCEHQGVLQGLSFSGYAWGECLVCHTERPWSQVHRFNEELRKLALDLDLAGAQEKQPESALD